MRDNLKSEAESMVDIEFCEIAVRTIAGLIIQSRLDFDVLTDHIDTDPLEDLQVEDHGLHTRRSVYA
jgi:hypothetical protein